MANKLEKPLTAIFYSNSFEDEKDEQPVNWSLWWENDLSKGIFEKIAYLGGKIPGLLEALKGKVLDVGCGAGHLVKNISSKYQNEVHGIDISNEAIAAGKKKGIENLITGDITKKMPFPKNYFDFIVSTNSIFSTVCGLNSRKAFENVMSHLKKGGFFYATTFATYPDCGSINFLPFEYENYHVKKGFLVKGAKAFSNYEDDPRSGEIIIQKIGDKIKIVDIPMKKGKLFYISKVGGK